MKEYLSERIRDRSRWLEGRYGQDTRETDHTRLLQVLRDSPSSVIRRPPLAARRLLQENRKPNTSLGRLAEIIETDPGLLQALLKHANSAYYATALGGNPIASVPPALQRLGSKGIEIVVMSQMVEGALCRPGAGLDEMAGAVWSHMVRVAPLARALAPGFGADPEEAYALGLLHDVGKLVFFNRVADLRKSLRRPIRMAPGFLPAALRELHEPLGSLALLEWGLGDESARAVAHHHRNPPLTPPCPLSEVLFVAERLDLQAGSGEGAPELAALWRSGELTAPLPRVAAIWERMPRKKEAPAA